MVVARWRCFQLREYHRSLISLSLEVKVDVCEYHRSLIFLSLEVKVDVCENHYSLIFLMVEVRVVVVVVVEGAGWWRGSGELGWAPDAPTSPVCCCCSPCCKLPLLSL